MPKDNENMRAFYHFIANGTVRDSSWFRPLQRMVDEEVPTRLCFGFGNSRVWLLLVWAERRQGSFIDTFYCSYKSISNVGTFLLSNNAVDDQSFLQKAARVTTSVNDKF